jgi:hypothetical protein
MVCLAAETTWIATEGECDSGSNGGINDKRDVKQGKVLILYNTIRKVSSD